MNLTIDTLQGMIARDVPEEAPASLNGHVDAAPGTTQFGIVEIGDSISADQCAQAREIYRAKSFLDAANEKPIPWSVEGLLTVGDASRGIPGSTLLLSGDPGAGKSFVVLWLGVCLALGLPFANRFEIDRPYRVGLFVGEGQSRYMKRVQAALDWLKSGQAFSQEIADRGPVDIEMLGKNLDIFYDVPKFAKDRAADWDSIPMFARIVKDEGYDVVVIDTYRRATPGLKEISQEDTAKVYDLVSQVSRATGAACVFTHHLNKSGGVSGSTNLVGSSDASLTIEVVNVGGRKVRYLKEDRLKDSGFDGDIAFDLVPIESAREEGEKYAPVAVQWLTDAEVAEIKSEKKGEAALTDVRAEVLGILKGLSGEYVDTSGMAERIFGKGASASDKKTVKRAFDALAGRYPDGKGAGYVSLVGEGTKPKSAAWIGYEQGGLIDD